MVIHLLVLALALSIDAFGIGVSYGIRKINFKITSLFIISFIAFSFSSISIWFGNIIASIFSEKITSFISILILVMLGIFVIKKALEDDEIEEEKSLPVIDKEHKNICSFVIKSLGVTINIIKTPYICDIDKSLKIEPKEALFLGIALSLDSIATSIYVSSFKGYSFFFPIFIVIFQLTFLLLGRFLGGKANLKALDENKLSIISGTTLIIIAFARLVFYK